MLDGLFHLRTRASDDSLMIMLLLKILSSCFWAERERANDFHLRRSIFVSNRDPSYYHVFDSSLDSLLMVTSSVFPMLMWRFLLSNLSVMVMCLFYACWLLLPTQYRMLSAYWRSVSVPYSHGAFGVVFPRIVHASSRGQFEGKQRRSAYSL